jgi:hypothetical protein
VKEWLGMKEIDFFPFQPIETFLFVASWILDGVLLSNGA